MIAPSLPLPSRARLRSPHQTFTAPDSSSSSSSSRRTCVNAIRRGNEYLDRALAFGADSHRLAAEWTTAKRIARERRDPLALVRHMAEVARLARIERERKERE